MEIAVVIESIEPRRGGAETSTVQFVHQLARKGCRVHVITASRVPDSPEMTVHAVPVQRSTRSARSAQFAELAAAEVRQRRYDVVHSMLPLPECDVYQPRGGTVAESVDRNLALIRSRPLQRAKQVGNRLNAKQQALLDREAHLFSRCPGIVVAAVSQYVVDQLRRHYDLDASRIRLVFNGADVPDVTEPQRAQNRREVREAHGLSPDDLVLLMVAHNFRLKGVDRGIEAVAAVADREGLPVRALVVGRDSPGRCRRLAVRRGVGDRITFVGPSERVAAFYDAADVLIHPTYYDPCSRVVLEALAGGLPAITTRHNGAAEVIEDGKHGYVIESADDVDALADRIRRLADDEHRHDCGANARQLRKQLGMDRHAAEMMAVYDEILGRRDDR